MTVSQVPSVFGDELFKQGEVISYHYIHGGITWSYEQLNSLVL